MSDLNAPQPSTQKTFTYAVKYGPQKTEPGLHCLFLMESRTDDCTAGHITVNETLLNAPQRKGLETLKAVKTGLIEFSFDDTTQSAQIHQIIPHNA